MKEDKRRRKFKKVYKNNKIYVKVAREMIYFFVGIGYLIKETLIETFKDIVRLITGLIYLLIQLLKAINTLGVKLFNKLPKLTKIAIIYCLIALSIVSIYYSQNVVLASTVNQEKNLIIETKNNEILNLLTKNKTLSEENKNYIQLRKKLEQTKYELQKLKTINSFNNIERDIYNKGIEVGLSHEQSIMIVAISKHETGHWKSPAFIDRNNFGGVMASYGIKIYASYEDGLDGFVALLKNRYFDKGLDTIEKIQPIYCPVGAKNDPNNKNIYWLPTVTQFYNEYLTK